MRIHVDPSGDQLNLAFVQYTFTAMLHSFIQEPHESSKERTPYVCTMPSPKEIVAV